jgi:hypothetical protein
MDERRRYERIRLPESAKAYVIDDKGTRIGMVRVIGAGGFFLETDIKFPEFTPQKMTLMDEAANICRRLTVVTRHAGHNGSGFEFLVVDIATAVDVGIIIGRYLYGARAAGAN